MSAIITLLTDFGLQDPFVGMMKGVILSRFAAATLVDLCHGLAPQNIVEGAFWIERSHAWFPLGTVHVVIVDPGVGSERAALAVQADGQLFVGPDNGLLGGVALRPGAIARVIDVARVGLPEPSRTFHGRDVFAPVAAELASGRLAFEAVGPVAHAFQPSAVPPCSVAGPIIEGCVVSIDVFGNLITNIDGALVEGLVEPQVSVGPEVCRLAGTYADVPAAELVAVVNAYETIEIAVRNGSAAGKLGIERGARVFVRGNRS